MIEQIGDIFEHAIERGGIIAHGVNCRGVMGGGIALSVATRWPTVKDAYFKKVANTLDPNALIGHVQIVDAQDGLKIANCFTQADYGKERIYVSYDALDECMRHLAKIDVPIHVPMIGSGLAGGVPAACREIIRAAFIARPDCCLYYQPA